MAQPTEKINRAQNWIWVRSGSGKWQIQSGASTPQLIRRLAHPEALMCSPAEPLTKDLPHKPTYVVRHVSSESWCTAVIIKRYRSKSFWRSLRYSFGKSPARRAFEKAFLLQRLEISTAVPVAAGEIRRFGWLMESFLILEEVPEARPLRQTRAPISAAPHNPGLMRKLARLIAKIHNSGLQHSDPTLGNFLVQGANPRCGEFVVIDLDGLRRCKNVSLQSGVRDLRLLLRRIPMSPRERLWFLAQYAKDRGRPIRELIQMFAN